MVLDPQLYEEYLQNELKRVRQQVQSIEKSVEIGLTFCKALIPSLAQSAVEDDI